MRSKYVIRHRKPSKSASAVVRQLFDEIVPGSGLNQIEILEATGYSPFWLQCAKFGHSTPSIKSIEDVAQYLGYELTFKKMG